MKRKTLSVLLALEAVLCVVLCMLQVSAPGVMTTALAFPLEQIGLGLRALSLSGAAGNIAAVVIYAVLSLLPLLALLLAVRKRDLCLDDILLGALCPCLFAVLYLMVNPGKITAWFGEAAGISIGKAILGGSFYSLLCGYLVLRTLRLFFAGDTEKLQKYLSVLLAALNVLFVYSVFGPLFGSMLDGLRSLREANQGNEDQLGLSYVFLVLKYLVSAVPYFLDILVTFSAMDLLSELRRDRYSQAAVLGAHRLARLCGKFLAVSVCLCIGFNLLQFLFIRKLHSVSFSVVVPLTSIAFVLAALLLARYIEENKRLKDDNDLFI